MWKFSGIAVSKGRTPISILRECRKYTRGNFMDLNDLSTGSLDKYLVTLLDTYQVLHWRQHTQGIKYARGRGTNPMKGFPDRAGITKKGRFWAAEIKGPGDTLSDKQIDWIHDLEANKAIVVVIRTYEDCIDFVGRLIHN